MNRLSSLIILVLLHFIFFHVKAQSSIGQGDPNSQNFQPSVGIVIAILSLMFSVTLLLLVYAKFCHRPGPAAHHGDLPQNFAFIRSSSRFSGIDKTVIESLPFFRFSSLKGSKEGLECAVCLSKFEDIEMLRLLPKCKHAFHIACIDSWLEKHASCPICRHRVSPEDPTIFTYTHSMRLMNQSELQGEEANIGLFVQREEEDHHRGSSRFSIGSSFRKAEKGNNKEEISLIQEEAEEQKVLHKHKHKIVVSDFVFKNRWSSVSSSDLMFLNSEMLTSLSSNRFSCLDSNTQQSTSSGAAENAQIVKIKEEMEMKRSFESKVSALNKTSPVSFPDLPSTSSYMSPGERRSMSEITALSRYEDSGMKNRIGETSLLGNTAKEERLRRLWLPIAKRTVQWYANRDRRSQQPQKTQHELDV
ncbi:E3 ubiquitin-protein ligase ATL42 [Corylus avellana]|uniref:E3 ubiquitin-protein ligase ATL42 n=1 Tax=Corylus avellana TaxID=13451 RepID=UPI001E23D639|nr:E3 ubiquitin-protein ligase ATL42 [Corylus avellana]